MRVYYAHSDLKQPGKGPQEPGARWQLLEDHLRQTGKLAGDYAKWFGAEEWGRVSGLWHDLGKFHNVFQQRLRGAPVTVEHAGVGACWAIQRDRGKGVALGFVIAGHHSGLPNLQAAEEGSTPLMRRLERNAGLLAECRPNIPEALLAIELPDLPATLQGRPSLSKEDSEKLYRYREMWTRFLFSCLVDADRSDTAAFCDPDHFHERRPMASMGELRHRCDQYIEDKAARLSPDQQEQVVNRVRGEVLGRCREAAQRLPGIFTLTVPTGGGKTLSGMAFALHHAERHGLRRVFVVIPYTSIIEQNAAVYRECLGGENVLEHHSNLSPEILDETQSDTAHKLAAENWDMPVIVTTTVQFFETLFASRPSQVRKLHNVARSVIVLDEVQALPPGLLNPILDGLNTLVEQYGCSVVLSTATPPALAYRDRFQYGLKDIQHIIEDPQGLADRLRRVIIEWPRDGQMPWSIPELVDRLSAHERVLCVVHRRRDAREAAGALAEQTGHHVFHLSALMCPAHRLNVVGQIHRRLKEGGPCRVVSTQLVEAGVDLDFPVVYRALGGLDNIVQAAGRCNREGRLADGGRVVVFRAASQPPAGVPRKALQVTESLLQELGGAIDTADPACFEKYFRQLYFVKALDEYDIQRLRGQFDFASVGRRFKMIEDKFTYTVIVPWGDAEEGISKLREAVEEGRSTCEVLRRLQPYTVSIYARSYERLRAAGALEEVLEGVHILTAPYRHLYSEVYGLTEGDEPIQADPEALIG